MQPRYALELIILAAIWGAAFLFMRISAPEFGPIPLVELRTVSATLFLIPFLLVTKDISTVLKRWQPLFIISLITTILPYSLLSYTSLYAPAGYVSILNATVPMFSALTAFFWLNERLALAGIVGILLGFLGVFVLTMDKTSLDQSAGMLPVTAALIASFLYGYGANYTRVKLQGISPLVISAGSQFYASITLLPFAYYFWPTEQPSYTAWTSGLLLGIACTAIALVMFFRLIDRLGSTKTVMVAYLIPVFGMIWGYLLLNETITLNMLLGGILTIGGVAITTGFSRFAKVTAN